MKNTFKSCLPLLSAAILTCQSTSAFKIQIDYSLDDSGFFDSPESREALRAVCDFYESIITDDLAAIEPSTWGPGETWTGFRTHPTTFLNEIVTDMEIPEDTFILYVGSFDRSDDDIFDASAVGAPCSARQVISTISEDSLHELNDLVFSRGQVGALLPPSDSNDFLQQSAALELRHG